MRALVDFIDLGANGASCAEHKELSGGRHFEFDMAGGYSGPQLLRQLEAYEREPTPLQLAAVRWRADAFGGRLGCAAFRRRH